MELRRTPNPFRFGFGIDADFSCISSPKGEFSSFSRKRFFPLLWPRMGGNGAITAQLLTSANLVVWFSTGQFLPPCLSPWNMSLLPFCHAASPFAESAPFSSTEPTKEQVPPLPSPPPSPLSPRGPSPLLRLSAARSLCSDSPTDRATERPRIP